MTTEYKLPYTGIEISKKLNDIDQIESAFEYVYGNNILDPNNKISDKYRENETLEVKSRSGYAMTENTIKLKVEKQKLYVRTDLENDTSSARFWFQFLNSAGEYIDQGMIYFKDFATAENGYKAYNIPNNATQFHANISGTTSGHSFENLCISYEPLDAFESFTNEKKRTLKESALPDQFIGLPGQVESLGTQIASLIPKLHGKIIVNFGDSIFGLRRPPDDISTKLAALTGATVHNCGFGGCTMAWHGSGTSANPSFTSYDPFSMYRLADEIVKADDDATKWELQDAAIASDTSLPSYYPEALQILKDLDFSAVDIITIAYGTNDLTRDNTLDNESDRYKTTTFAGALRYSIEKLLTAYPHLKIFLCSQTFRFWVKNGEVTNTVDNFVTTKGNKLTDFIAKTEEVAKEYNLPYINNYDVGMNLYNRGYYFSATDGTHPLTVGLHLIAANMAKELF